MDNSQLILEFNSYYYTILRSKKNVLEQANSKSSRKSIGESETWHSLRFNPPPKNVQSGFVFGTDPDKCDITMIDKFNGTRNAANWQFFSITFDEHGRLILKDLSHTGLAVGQNYQHENEFRHDFLWVLFGQTISVKVKRHEKDTTPGIIHLKVPDYSSRSSRFYSSIREYLYSSKKAITPLGSQGLERVSITAYPSYPQISAGQAPIYHKISDIGKGGFGVVEEVMNVSTGKIYARKRFGQDESFRNEIDILSSLEHDNIVRFVDYQLDLDPCLVMEYLRLGNVRQQHRKEPFDRFEIIHLFSQVLAALNYLYSRSIAHRDIKPENVLVKSRKSHIVVCLADFGLSTTKSILQTHCGTSLYMAPEISGFGVYTPSVDIWSLAVVILDLYIGLPMAKYAPKPSWSWHGEIVGFVDEQARASPADLLLYLLVNMLRIDPKSRMPAQECARQLVLTEASLRPGSISSKSKRLKRPITESPKVGSGSEVEEERAAGNHSSVSKGKQFEGFPVQPA